MWCHVLLHVSLKVVIQSHVAPRVSVRVITINQQSKLKNPVHHDQTELLEIDQHFISEKVAQKTIQMKYVPQDSKLLTYSPKVNPRINWTT
ncbi:hypothetical protein LINPERPRIM_LOCUS38986 [Linum perenne]